MKLYQLYTDFYDYSKNYKNRSDLTIYSYRTHLNRFRDYLCIKHSTSEVGLENITLPSILDFISRIRQGDFRTRGSGPVSNKTTHHYITTIKTFLKRCYMMDYECLKWDKIPSVECENHYIADILTPKQVKMMRDCARREENRIVGLRNLLIMQIAYYTGMRGQEIIKLSFDQILHPTKQVKIVGKKNRTRTVYINDEVRKTARNLLHEYEMYDPRLIRPDYALLSLSTSWFGQPITSTTIKKFIRQYREHLGLSDKIVLHSFRHTFATTLLMNNVDLRTVQRGLGHASIKSTQMYTHIPNSSFQMMSNVLETSLS